MIKRLVAVMLLSLIIAPAVQSQTVHVSEINYFVGRMARDEGRDGAIDCSGFVDWFVEKPDPFAHKSDRRPRLRALEFSRGRHLLADWAPLSEQDGRFVWSGSGTDLPRQFADLRWYILTDYFGHERRRNVLTAWKLVEGDSLTYVCGQVGPFDASIGRADVRRVTTFPDSSLLLVVENRGEGRCRFDFLRGLSPCDFVRFYSRSFVPFPDHDEFGPHERVFYNFDRLIHPAYQLTEVTEISSLVPQRDVSFPTSLRVLDSASAEIIDLWQLAKTYFQIDTASGE